MTYKHLIEEINGLSVSDYKEVVSFLKNLKKKTNVKLEDNSLNSNFEDWTVSNENWNEIEIW